jgi:hypothetical protein
MNTSFQSGARVSKKQPCSVKLQPLQSRPTIWCWPIWSNWMVSRQACRHNGLRCFRGKSAATWRTISMISSATTSRLLASATLNK